MRLDSLLETNFEAVRRGCKNGSARGAGLARACKTPTRKRAGQGSPTGEATAEDA